MTITVDVRAVSDRDGVQWLSQIPSTSLIVARSMRVVPAALRDHLDIARDYDELLDGAVDRGLADRICDDLLAFAAERRATEVVYVLGPAGAMADATVRRLADRANVLTSGGALPPIGGQFALVDALTLAEARAAAPFDAGMSVLDPTVTTVVTNWYGDGVTAAAGEYLRQRLGISALPGPSDDQLLIIHPVETPAGNASLANLRQIYARLRRPDGCPWDREQSEMSTLGYIHEEIAELQEAMDQSDWRHATEEFGDILGNLIMIAQIAEEEGRFSLEDAITALSAKLVRRHPHVFGDERAGSADDVLAIWNRVKQQENAVVNPGGSTTE